MAESLSTQILFWALIGGILPAVFWLWFWLKEDKKKPEPRSLILLSFVSGMLAVPLALLFETLTYSTLAGVAGALLFGWAGIEEILKYAVARAGSFHSKYFDEPIDAVIYMITVALGFSALENSLFLIGAFQDGGVTGWLAVQNSRFIGATMLHVAASSFVGLAIGFSYYKSLFWKRVMLFLGLSAAILLHGFFNFFIMNGKEENIFQVFLGVWIIIIGIMILFEKLKRLRPKSAIQKTKIRI